MIPKTYRPNVLLKDLERVSLDFIQTDWDIKFWLEFVGFPKKSRDSITGMVVKISDGDLEAIWLSESNGPFWVDSHYHPLAYYRPKSWVKKNLPEYWLEKNPEYSV